MLRTDRNNIVMPGPVRTVSGPNQQAFSSAPTCRNRILASLPVGELELVRPHLFRVSLVASQVLYEKGVPPDAVYFVEHGIVALLAEVGGDETIQVALTGFEGVRGASVMLQPDLVTEYRSIVEIPGAAYRIQVGEFHRVISQAPLLRELCVLHTNSFVRQIAQTSACNARHDLPTRLCRLLLMVHDRSDGDDVLLTQGQIARMIGVRRAGVSTVMAMLQNSGLLRQARGRVTITDRQGLRDHACACYDQMSLA